ncbi:His Kinase A (phospho-acceptor) domain-containing protein [Reichenbachiella faecimaris]|uniref:histidine kinase n=1 Tax=Reichenbachiella faecimaris TaxID=692418 RepID=A0A1W2G6V7_REIFA|nr:histidine kinase dimerization/phospho-acceptor domain-containing protein [Reichenbachiella faecimaris]SMD32405.1 His Kinase A (phospho-acceptor) domain-containing protein [Reichenbachiella faecimaris]
MFAQIQLKIKASPVWSDLVNAVFFGLLSILFGHVKINLPVLAGIIADFREIPLLISIFYLRSIWPLAIVCGLTLLTPSSVSPITVYFMHLAALLFAWIGYHYLLARIQLDWYRALTWTIICTIYYFIFIIPLLILINQWISPNEGFNFIDFYLKMTRLIKYEWIVTALVTTMYLVQLDIRRKLVDHEMTLEKQVKDRTQALASANEKLQLMNENLDDLAIQRSLRIKDQLNTLNKYAHMNSHELRAPLSNILGLVDLLKKGKDEKEQLLLLEKLGVSAENLDTIIKEMNLLLEKEMKLPADRKSV